MKKIILFLLVFSGISTAWGQMPTATPSPNLIFKTRNLNFSNAAPPLNLYIYRHQYPPDAAEINTALRDIVIQDKNGKSAVAYGTRTPGDLFDVGDNANKDDIYFEEFKFYKKIDPNLWLVKLPVPEKDKWMYQGGNRDALAGLFAKDYSKIFCLENTSSKINLDDIKNDETLNTVVRVNGFYPYAENDKSTNYIKLDVVSSDEKDVWNPLPTPTVNPDKAYDFMDLSMSGTALIGKDVAGQVTVIQKVNDSDYLVSFEPGEGMSRIFYLTNAVKASFVDDQTILISAKVLGTRSYVTTLNAEKTVIELKLIKFSTDGQKIIKVN